jgi:hypothetical protein
LVNDFFHDDKPFNIDKLFKEASMTESQQAFENGSVRVKSEPTEDMLMRCDNSIFNLKAEEFTSQHLSEVGLDKLFEDPEERELRIKNSIEQSQIRKRQRLNSGNSNQSKKRS